MKNILLGLFIITQLSNSFAQSSKNTEKPNIILILSDDHSAKFLGAYGNKDVKTPNLDQFAKDGIRFNHVFTTSPQCTPSRASLMTGRSAVDIRMTRFASPLQKDIITYPEVLRKGGYYTGISGRTYHLDGPGKNGETGATLSNLNLRTFQDRVDYLKVGGNETVYPEFVEFLDKKPANKPFFIQLGYNDPHTPYTAKSFEPNPNDIKVPEGMPDIPEVRKQVAGYIGEVQHLDSLVGKIIAEVKSRNLEKNTVVIFMGDNGAALLRGKGTLYDLGLHVPLLVRWPASISKNQVSNTLISGEDLAPTILDIAQLPIPETFTGKSFKPSFTNSNFESHEYIFAERGAHGSSLPNSTVDFDLSRTVFSKKYKLIYNALWQLPYTPVDFAQGPSWVKIKELHQSKQLAQPFERLFFNNGKERPMFEFFDLEKDPQELNNLAGNEEYKDIEHQFKNYLNEWMIIYQDYLPLPLPPNAKKSQK